MQFKVFSFFFQENDEGINKEVGGLLENQLIESNGKSTNTDVQVFLL